MWNATLDKLKNPNRYTNSKRRGIIISQSNAHKYLLIEQQLFFSSLFLWSSFFLLLYLLWFTLIFSPIQAYSMGCCVFVAYIGEYAEMDICWCCFIHFKIANNSRLTHSTDPKHNPPSKQTIWTKDDKKGERNSKIHTDTLNTQFANKLE